MSWEEIKQGLELYTGLTRDALHIHMAVLIQLLVAIVTRRGMGHPLPWLIVLVLEVLNERSDMYLDGVLESWEHQAAIHDLWNTMLLPTVLLLVARFAPGLASRPPVADASRPDGETSTRAGP